MVTGYGLHSPRIESRWGPDFLHLSRLALGPPSLLYNGYRVLSGGKEWPRRDTDPSPLLVPWSRKSRAIPQLPLWAVQPVQSLSAVQGCTLTVFHLYFNTCLYLHSYPKSSLLAAAVPSVTVTTATFRPIYVLNVTITAPKAEKMQNWEKFYFRFNMMTEHSFR